jgi:hypothetical protein
MASEEGRERTEALPGIGAMAVAFVVQQADLDI